MSRQQRRGTFAPLLPATAAAIGLIVLDQCAEVASHAGLYTGIGGRSADHCMKNGSAGTGRGAPDRLARTAPVGSAKAGGGDVVVHDAEGRSALTLRMVLASFGLVVCGGAAVLFVLLELPVIFVSILVLLAVIAAVDLVIVGLRKHHGEPG